MTPKLSRVYLDDLPIRLMGDEARPRLSRIVRASGKRPDRFDVRWLESPSDPKGLALDADEIMDRTLEPTKAIYLRSVPRPAGPPLADGSAQRRPTPPLAQARHVIAQLGATPPAASDNTAKETAPPEPAVPRLYRGPLLARQAAEAEAEERQEEQRNAEDLLQDEDEAVYEAAEDDVG